MRRLILMRHAKSSWADAGQADIDRPLNDRGARDAPSIGAWLRMRGYLPDHALVSTARRTRETWSGVAGVIGARPTGYMPRLYGAGPETLLTVLRAAPDVSAVLMLGHQPGIGAFARRLLRRSSDDADFAKYPTAATAIIDFDADHWQAADWATGSLTDFVTPRALE